MNKKILAILCIAFLAVVCVSSVQAADTGQKVTIGGIDFNIPAGFEEDTVFQIDNVHEDGVTNDAKGFTDGTDLIYVCVGEFDDSPATDSDMADIGESPKTLNGVSGYSYEGSLEDWDGDLYGFIYVEDGKAVMVFVSDESLFDGLFS